MQTIIHLRCGKGTDLILINYITKFYLVLIANNANNLEINKSKKFGTNDSCVAAKMMSLMSMVVDN